MAEQKKQSKRPSANGAAVDIKDKGGRRRVADRRQNSSSGHFPERRDLGYRRGARVNEAEDALDFKDRGGRRRLADRRHYSSSDHFPERRTLRYRRSGNDRRNLQNQKIRKKLERRQMFKDRYSK